MTANSKVCEWNLGPVLISLDPSEYLPRIRQQTPGSDLLYTLARAKVRGVAECALDLIFEWNSFDVDVLKAYSENPLQSPPKRYVSLFYEVDWTKENPSEQTRAIIMAGTEKEEEKVLLLRLLRTLKVDFRDGALFAAGSFDERRFIEAVSSIALGTSEAEAVATGEIHAFTFCFNRWLEREVINLTQLGELLRSIEPIQSPNRISWKRLLNYAVCQQWPDIPFPEEYGSIGPTR